MHTVRMAASRGYSLGWVNYDEQDRLRKATSLELFLGGCRHGVVDVVRVNPSVGQYRVFDNVERQSHNSPPPLPH